MKRILLFVAVAVLMPACSLDVSRTLDTSDVEEQVESDILSKRDIEVEVECPREIEAEEGERFTCAATDDSGTSLDVEVLQMDSSGDVDWTLAILNLAKIESDLAPLVSDAVEVPITVRCPRVLVASDPGASVDCQATDASGGEGVLRVTATDDEGNVDWELNP